jgi:hypothetical protein
MRVVNVVGMAIICAGLAALFHTGRLHAQPASLPAETDGWWRFPDQPLRSGEFRRFVEGQASWVPAPVGLWEEKIN